MGQTVRLLRCATFDGHSVEHSFEQAEERGQAAPLKIAPDPLQYNFKMVDQDSNLVHVSIQCVLNKPILNRSRISCHEIKTYNFMNTFLD